MTFEIARNITKATISEEYGVAPSETMPRFPHSVRFTIRDIEIAICDRFKLTPAELRGQSRKRCYARPRQITMYLALRMTNNGLSAIGRYFDRDHTTVIHAKRKIERLLAKPRFAELVAACRNAVQPRSLPRVAMPPPEMESPPAVAPMDHYCHSRRIFVPESSQDRSPRKPNSLKVASE